MIKQFLNKEILEAIIRHGLTTMGGILVAKGLANTTQITSVTQFLTSSEAVGVYNIVGGIVLSFIHKIEVAREAAKIPQVNPPIPPQQQQQLIK